MDFVFYIMVVILLLHLLFFFLDFLVFCYVSFVHIAISCYDKNFLVLLLQQMAPRGECFAFLDSKQSG